MKSEFNYDDYYDRVFSEIFISTVGDADAWRQCYRGAKIFGRFLLSELDRKETLQKAGETVLVRRGLVPSDAVFNKWLWETIQDSNHCRVPLPFEMMTVLSRVLPGVGTDNTDPHLAGARDRFEKLRIIWREVRNVEVPTRRTARELGVNEATISRWKKFEPLGPDDFDLDKYMQVLERTNAEHFRREGEKWVGRSTLARRGMQGFRNA